ncbi:MAG: hypothetical protein L0387_44595 [Acidobacteria bacterium]|nr:hypothetical protein [Acidobacteriota bacterium]
MRLLLGNQRCIAAAERVTSAGYQTGSTALNDRDGLIIKVRVTGQRSSRSKLLLSFLWEFKLDLCRNEIATRTVLNAQPKMRPEQAFHLGERALLGTLLF